LPGPHSRCTALPALAERHPPRHQAAGPSSSSPPPSLATLLLTPSRPAEPPLAARLGRRPRRWAPAGHPCPQGRRLWLCAVAPESEHGRDALRIAVRPPLSPSEQAHLLPHWLTTMIHPAGCTWRPRSCATRSTTPRRTCGRSAPSCSRCRSASRRSGRRITSTCCGASSEARTASSSPTRSASTRRCRRTSRRCRPRSRATSRPSSGASSSATRTSA